MRAAKRSRLLSVAGVGRVSDKGLQEILEAVRLEPSLLEDNTDAAAIQRALDSLADSVGTYSTLVQEDGTEFRWFRARPAAVLSYFMGECPDFARLFNQRLLARPCTPDSPWRLILYLDEATPGSALRPDNRRKGWLVFFSFVDLGAELLCREEFWLPFGFIRSVIVKQVRGGLSAVFKEVLRSFFIGDESFDEVGVMINGSLFFAKLTNLLADDDALTKVYCVKGAGGLLPCLECKNVLAADRSVVPGGYFVTVACSDPKRFDMLDDQDQWDRVDQLEDRFQRNSEK